MIIQIPLMDCKLINLIVKLNSNWTHINKKRQQVLRSVNNNGGKIIQKNIRSYLKLPEYFFLFRLLQFPLKEYSVSVAC